MSIVAWYAWLPSLFSPFPVDIAILESPMPYTSALTKEEIEERLRSLYSEEGCTSLAALATRPSETIAQAVARTRNAYDQRGERPLRYFPADFMGETEGTYALPFPQEAAWKTLGAYADLFAVTKGAILIAPLYWQTEPIFWDAMHARKVPTSVMHGGNIPLAREIIRQAAFEMVVVDADLLDAVCADLQANGVLETLKVIVSFAPLSKISTVAHTSPSGVLTLREGHLIPGCPLLYQEPAEAGTDHFRIHEDFLVEMTSEGTYATALSASVFPAVRMRLPIRLAQVTDGALCTII